jgi:hypothetical protein
MKEVNAYWVSTQTETPAHLQQVEVKIERFDEVIIRRAVYNAFNAEYMNPNNFETLHDVKAFRYVTTFA